MNVYTLKTCADAFLWLCQLESELLNIQAFQRAGLYPPDDGDEEPAFECAVYNSGLACGEFQERLEGGDIAPLSGAGKELLSTLEQMGRTLCESLWIQAINQGRYEVRADRAIYDAEADGWVYGNG